LIVVTSFLQSGGNGHYKLQMTCNNGACVAPPHPRSLLRRSRKPISIGTKGSPVAFGNGNGTFRVTNAKLP